MEKQTVITLSIQQRNEIIALLDSNNQSKARYAANFLEGLEQKEIVLASDAQAQVESLTADLQRAHEVMAKAASEPVKKSLREKIMGGK